ncbi:MAG: beta-N-acetylhexosaminidase [Pseudomonadota bacterium]
MSAQAKAMIVGCSGTVLSAEERAFLAQHKPWGLILFARNIGSADEIRAITSTFREIVGREDAPVFIDQEGGRVQRIKPPLAQDYPSGAMLGTVYEADAQEGLRAAHDMSRLHACDLLPLGINADCLPVLDIPIAGSHDVIGNRAYGDAVEIVARMGRAAADGLLAGSVLPVMKHVPGHGRATVDSHKALPVVDTPAETLEKIDFEPFRLHADLPMAMTAHVVYTAYDADNPATTSSTVIDRVIRGHIGFDGLLMTDDLSMHALSGDFAARTEASFAAGCDVVLHCNGVMDEMVPVAEATGWLDGKALDRAEAATNLLRSTPTDGDEIAVVRERFNRLVSATA